ncbi:MAG: hypothetical protein ACTSU2_09040 [Promethearchaeota archaeon]
MLIYIKSLIIGIWNYTHEIVEILLYTSAFIGVHSRFYITQQLFYDSLHKAIVHFLDWEIFCMKSPP